MSDKRFFSIALSLISGYLVYWFYFELISGLSPFMIILWIVTFTILLIINLILVLRQGSFSKKFALIALMTLSISCGLLVGINKFKGVIQVSNDKPHIYKTK